MVELTIDGKKVSVQEGSMVIHAAQELGVYVPHFCYHDKLSIAANCRMCLVEVEKAPKTLPACATPVTDGMVVHTASPKAVAAQKAVMEFLLINHPLDCPICDQGGECQLQDLAVGYGHDTTQYTEEKRVVFHKSMGPLVSAEEMTRCIHCTRCIRVGTEIAGMKELGMKNRGEHSEITTFVGRAIESELSGNMIDVCPVGALTSKPFRYAARTWELARRRSVSPHDSVGANLVVQVKNEKVLRVVPFENEEVNECWISDKDRFSYEGLYAPDRLQVPMVKNEDGVWRESSWEDALTHVGDQLQRINETAGLGQIGALATETSTLEELRLLARLVRGLGSEHIDSRLLVADENLEQAFEGAPWLGMPITDLNHLDSVLIIGSNNLRKDHPLFAQRLRQAAKTGAKIAMIDAYGQDPLFPLAEHLVVPPSQLNNTVAQVMQAVKDLKAGQQAEEDHPIHQIASLLVNGENKAVLLGNAAVHSKQASNLAAHSQQIVDAIEGRLGFLTAGANTVGAYVAEATPKDGGMNYPKMLDNPLKAYLVLHAELLDMDNSNKAKEMLSNAFTVALTAYKSDAQDWATVMLPVAPFTETSGTFVNAEGRPQSFKGVVPSLGLSRPAWKVLRVLGNVMKLSNFDDESTESIRDEALGKGITGKLNNQVKVEAHNPEQAINGLERVADFPIYRTDAVVRRASSLQQATPAPVAQMNAATLAKLELEEGAEVLIKSNTGSINLTVSVADQLADNTVRVPLGFEQTAALGSACNQLSVERV